MKVGFADETPIRCGLHQRPVQPRFVLAGKARLDIVLAMTMSYIPPNELLTARLKLRPSARSDAEAIYKSYATDPQVTRYLSWYPHKALEDTLDFLARCDRARDAGTDFAYVIEDRADGSMLGMIEVRVQEHAVEYAYVLRRDSWGHGIMTEALSALADNALSHPSIWRVYALCDVENPASA